jgi:hypothetical protein
MPSSLYIPRPADVDVLLNAITDAHCAALIGLSNTDVASRYHAETGRRVNLVYADCNRMLDLTDQGFYELILRAINESVRDFEPDLQTEVQTCYNNVIHPNSPFDIPLNFNNAMTAILERSQRDIVLLLDEFDEAFAALDGRVFLNLRALRDKYRSNLAYVTANVRRLGTFRTADDTSEFVELSATHTHVLEPLDEDATGLAVSALAEDMDDALTEEETAILLEESGGHPGLIDALTRALLRQPEAIRQGSTESLREVFDQDMSAVSECGKLWRQLLVEEQQTCLDLLGGAGAISERALLPLQRWGLVRDDALFSAFFDRFLRRQTLYTEDIPAGLVFDSDAGDVWVDGRQVPPLTDLEYRLLQLLHQRLGKVTDKYQIVESVWGIKYLNEVDDSRIEKLISRLRGKVEPDPATPRYLTTVRGRGYKLLTN